MSVNPSDNHANANRFFIAWGSFVVRFRWPLLVGTLAATWLFAGGAKRLEVNNDDELFLDQEGLASLEAYREVFGRDDVFITVAKGDVFSLPYLEKLRALHADIVALEVEGLGGADANDSDARDTRAAATGAAAPEWGSDSDWGDEAGGTVADEVTSLVNVRATTFEGGALKVAGLLDDWPYPGGPDALRERVMQREPLIRGLVDDDGRRSLIVVRTMPMDDADSARVYKALGAIMSKYESPDFDLMIGGRPAVRATVNDAISVDVRRLLLAARGLNIVILALIYRSIFGVLGPMAIVLLSGLWTLGAMGLSGAPMTGVSNILPGFLICVAIGSSIHLQSAFVELRTAGVEKIQAIAMAVGRTALPIAFCNLTTAASLYSFQWSEMQAIRSFGTFGAAGVMIILLQVLVVLPIVLSFSGARSFRHAPSGARNVLARLVARCVSLSRSERSTRPAMIVTIAGLVVLACATVATRVDVGADPLTWFSPDTEIVKATKEADQVGGAGQLSIMIQRADGHSIADLDFMRRLEKLERYIEAYTADGRKRVGHVDSVLDAVRESWRALNGNSMQHYAIPPTQQAVVDVVNLFSMSDASRTKRLVTVDQRTLAMEVRLNWMLGSDYRRFIDYVEQGIDRHVGDAANVRLTGGAYNAVKVEERLVGELAQSLGIALFTIIPVMALLLRSVRFGLLAMIPNAPPVFFVLGAMTLADIPLDMTHMLLAAIILGVSVDDTIHLFHGYLAHKRAGRSTEQAVVETFSMVGPASIASGIVLALGMLLYSGATMSTVRSFGVLAGLAVMVAIIADMLVLPALLRMLDREEKSEARVLVSAET
jgi:uncharacterized protein